jgi:hypothetical protein
VGVLVSDRSVSLVFALAAGLSLFGGVATAQRPAEPKPLWQVDERNLGLPRMSGGFFGFQNNDTLLISWTTPDAPVPPKKQPSLVPAHLHVLFLDAKAGTRLRERELSLPSGFLFIFISHSGNLLVRVGNSLKLYTPDFVFLNQAEFSAPDYPSRIDISPDGRRIALCSEKGLSPKAAIFDADDLKPLGSSPDGQQSCPKQLGDDSFLFMTYSGNSVQSAVQNGENEPHNPPLLVASEAHLLNGDAFMFANGNSLVVRTIDGKPLMTDDLPKKHKFYPLTAKDARDSTIFAVETLRLTGVEGVPFFPIIPMFHMPVPDQIAVYSLKEKRRIFSIKVKGGYLGVGKYELSPDGSLFATESNGWLRVYKLP